MWLIDSTNIWLPFLITLAMVLWILEYLQIIPMLFVLLAPPPPSYQNPLLIEFGVQWSFCPRVLVTICIGVLIAFFIAVFIGVFTGMWTRLSTRMLLKLQRLHSKPLWKIVNVEKVPWFEHLKGHSQNVQLFSILVGFSYPQSTCFVLVPWSVRSMQLKLWTQLHCWCYLNHAWDLKCVKDWI